MLQPRDFWSKIDIRGPDECWHWNLCLNTYGYGHTKIEGKQTSAHRVAFALARGPIPEGLWVLHKCDNPRCCNPSHLFLGTSDDNIRDMISKGRHAHGDTHMSRVRPETLSRGDHHYARTNPERLARGERHGSRTMPDRLPMGSRNGAYTKPHRIRRGEDNGQSKLTEAGVIEIRRRRSAGERLRAIADDFKITEALVSLIALGRAWKHVPLVAAKADEEAGR